MDGRDVFCDGRTVKASSHAQAYLGNLTEAWAMPHGMQNFDANGIHISDVTAEFPKL